jgi:hypothetical protein
MLGIRATISRSVGRLPQAGGHPRDHGLPRGGRRRALAPAGLELGALSLVEQLHHGVGVDPERTGGAAQETLDEHGTRQLVEAILLEEVDRGPRDLGRGGELLDADAPTLPLFANVTTGRRQAFRGRSRSRSRLVRCGIVSALGSYDAQDTRLGLGHCGGVLPDQWRSATHIDSRGLR